MREFTNQEKWILRKTAELKKNKGMHSITLGDISVVFLQHEFIEIYLNKKFDSYNITFRFDCDKHTIENHNSIKQEIENKIIDTILLLKFLKENNLILEIKQDLKKVEFNINKSNYDISTPHYNISSNFDSFTKKLVVKTFSECRYFIRQECIDFVENDFKTLEERRFTKSHKTTWASIYVAISIGIISIIISITLFLLNDSTLHIDEKQVNQIDYNLNKINNSQLQAISNDSILFKSLNEKLDSVNEYFTISTKENQLFIIKSIIKENQYLFSKMEKFIFEQPTDSTTIIKGAK